MSKRRGVSLQDKRQRMMKIFFDEKSIFTLKELEKLGSKVGVIAQTVKDVIQGLIDDNLIDQDKIGSQNIYWAFPSKALVVRTTKIECLRARLQSMQENETMLTAKRKLLLGNREDTPHRQQLLEDHRRLTEEQSKLDAELKKYSKNDPEFLRELDSSIEVSLSAANRWTDNLYNLKSHIVKTMSRSGGEVDQFLQIDDSFDYVSRTTSCPL